MKRGNKDKKGVSPVIATVLLIAMVIVIGLIVFLWFRGLVVEEGTKFGKNIKLNCMDVKFEASYSNNRLNIVNIGNVPIYKMNIQIQQEGNYETQELSENWPETGLNQGEAFSGIMGFGEAIKIVLIPVLLGSYEEGQKIYICEDQYGYEIAI